MLFVLRLRYAATEEDAAPFVPGHVAFLERHHGTGTFLLSGQTVPTSDGGVILAHGPERAAVERLAAEDPFVLSQLVKIHADAGHTREAQAALGRLRALYDTAPTGDGAFWIALAYVSLGNNGKALDWLDLAIEAKIDHKTRVTWAEQIEAALPRGPEATAKALAALAVPLAAALPRRADDVNELPDAVRVLVGTVGRGRGSSLVRPHVGRPEAGVLVDGIRVTPVARTVVDLARTGSLHTAVAAADHALRHGLCTAEELRREVDAVPPRVRGRKRARLVGELADPLSMSAGESLSRVQMSVMPTQKTT